MFMDELRKPVGDGDMGPRHPLNSGSNVDRRFLGVSLSKYACPKT